MIRRGLTPLVTASRIVDAGSHPSARFTDAVRAIGSRISGVQRRGKYLLLPLDDEDGRLVIHLGMTGQLRVDTPGLAPDPYDRAWWVLDDGSRLALRDVRRFGRVALVGEDLSSLPTLAGLGPEPLGPDHTPEQLWAALRASRVRVKSQLLSQRPVAGVGNIYADEALWRAGINPAARTVTRGAAARLHRSIVEVLREGIDNGGTTLRDYRTADGGIGSNQHHLDCYGRAGEPCRRCESVLRRRTVDGRGTTWCPLCQPR